jgi:hypothetical protein
VARDKLVSTFVTKTICPSILLQLSCLPQLSSGDGALMIRFVTSISGLLKSSLVSPVPCSVQ